MLNCIKWIMHVWATVYPYRLHLKISTLLDIMYTYWVSPYFNAVGKKCRIRRGLKLYGNAKCIFIEDDVQIGARCVLEAYTEFQPASQTFTPHVVIGDGCKIGTDSHISSINSVILGKHVRCGRKIFITDNAHGASQRVICWICRRICVHCIQKARLLLKIMSGSENMLQFFRT